MKHALTALAVMSGSLVALPAQAVTFQFFEHNGCTGKKLGSIDSVNLEGFDKRFVTPAYGSWNDEARSVRVTSNWRTVRDIRRISLVVYDSVSQSTLDDWARIVVRDVTFLPVQGVCITSFEIPADGKGVYVETHPYNGLDGKVSIVGLECDKACRENLTTVPDSFKTKIGTRRR